ncbi:MAG TPA: 4Fe-4S dicluster domain-containing protein, partial [Anaerovoracaceae bacterium]|nr:4Fe-4S dicluster domain-containing protein [Anaerovoracaceae bacterium]
IDKKVATPFEEPSPSCIGCGACANVCPSGAIEITEENGRRIIWNNEFELVRCAECGALCGTREQMEHVNKKLDVKLEEYSPGMLCESCRAVKAAERLTIR